MGDLTRFGMSLDEALLERFDKLIKKQGYTNRSEAIRDLIRDRLIEDEWSTRQKGKTTMGVFSIVYNHHQRNLSEKLTDLQHHYVQEILSTTHIHIDHDHCLEVIILRGDSRRIRTISQALKSVKGVKHGKLITTTTGADLE